MGATREVREKHWRSRIAPAYRAPVVCSSMTYCARRLLWTGTLALLACAAPEQRLRPQTQLRDAGVTQADDDGESTSDAGEPGSRLEQAIAEADRSCVEDADCTLVEINTPCLPHCELRAVGRASGLEVLSRALRTVSESCAVDAGSGPWYSSFYCSARGFEARCRDGGCESAAARCSPGCSERGDSCVGAPGAVCQHCPADEDAQGPCAVLGQRCHYGECGGTLECLPAVGGNTDAGAWSLTISDCF